ncbi:MAG: cation transporter [Nanoarchaeota archaeon]|nr:cation transporter [Nanoarchaeota archaeon]
MEKIILSIKGMHCQSCELLIREALEENGVRKATASFEKGHAKVEFDPKTVSMDIIKEAIKEEGFEVE